MRRRRFIAGSVSLSALLSGCVWAENSDWESPTGQSKSPENSTPIEVALHPADGALTSTRTTTETAQPTQTPTLPRNQFISTYNRFLRDRGFEGDWELTMESTSVTISYTASAQTHRQSFENFLDAYIDLVRQTDTTRDARFVVMAGDRQWYAWAVSNDGIRAYLNDSQSHADLVSAVWESRTMLTTQTPTATPSPSPTPSPTATPNRTSTPTSTPTATPVDGQITIQVRIWSDQPWEGEIRAGGTSTEIPNRDDVTDATVEFRLSSPHTVYVDISVDKKPKSPLTVQILHGKRVVEQKTTRKKTVELSYTPPQAE